METKLDKPIPTTPSYPSYILPDESQLEHDQRICVTPHSLPSPPAFSFSPAASAHSPLPAPVPLVTPAKPKFVSYETVLYRKPGLSTCPSCQLQVTTQVTYRAGTLAWAVCFTMVLFGLVLGCCLIPLLVDYFKDAYHTCPRCRRLLYVHKKGCCK
uniref:LITAF domain-containing protein n=1 Tax=Neogobius melanostomus TaxID=47308 RepID=A0A8C6V6L4_9GOBI